jgi:hypothetical protein
MRKAALVNGARMKARRGDATMKATRVIGIGLGGVAHCPIAQYVTQ